MYRTHTCQQLNKKNVGQKVQLAGWVGARRDHGKIIFIDLRERSGLIQVVFIPQNKELYKLADSLRPEWVINVKGEVKERPKGMINPKLSTGEIELEVQELNILNKAKTLPFEIEGDGYEIKEDIRLRYRYLDLRRQRMLKNLKIRQEVKNFSREFLTKKGFIEIDTPILTKSTPEGARDFLVPSRHHLGKFYALPQSPQQYKQLLMVAGVEKYFQFPRCFRDEDLRADRLLEFDQWDLEMSFVDQEDVLKLTEELMVEICEKVLKKKILKKPFPRMSYKEAMKKYGTDRPDLTRSVILRRSDPPERSEGGEDRRQDPVVTGNLAFLWITDFPMFEKKEDGTIGAMHHPFTAIADEDISLLDQIFQGNPSINSGTIRAKQYDLVLNGQEIFGGSIRTYDPEILQKVFKVLGHSKEEIKQKFGHLLEAFEYGVPPHGGIAGGFARFLMAALGEKNIREVIPFPTTGKGFASVMNAPSCVDTDQLGELHLKVVED